jgi:hypothetical protein
MSSSSHGRVPRARVDPIQSMEDALVLFHAVMSRPIRAETLAVFLDDNSCGSTVVTVTGTLEPAHLLDVAEAMALSGASSPDVAALVLASVRPTLGLQPGDDDLWLRAADLVETSGLVLIDWFVITRHGTCSPRELLGRASRWNRC